MNVLVGALLAIATLVVPAHCQPKEGGAVKAPTKSDDQANQQKGETAKTVSTVSGETQLSPPAQPFVPGWLLGLVCVMLALQLLALVRFWGLRHDLSVFEEKQPKLTKEALIPVANSISDLGSRITDLRQDIAAVRQGQEPLVASALNSLTRGTQVPFAPQIVEIEPKRGSQRGGTRVVIHGRNFTPDTQVWFGGADAQVQGGSTTSRLVVVAPPSGLGQVDVCVINLNGMMSSQRAARYEYIEFSLRSLSPAAAGALQLSGSGFSDATEVFFNGQRLLPVNRTTSTMEVTPPAGTSGHRGEFVLVNPGGDRSDVREYIYP